MKKSTFMKKNTAAQLIAMAEELAIVLPDKITKRELVDLIYPLTQEVEETVQVGAIEKTDSALSQMVDEVNEKQEAVQTPEEKAELIASAADAAEKEKEEEEDSIPNTLSNLKDMDAYDAITKVFSEGLLYKIDANTWWGKSSKSRDTEVQKIDKSGKVASVVKTLIDPKHLGPIRAVRGKGERSVTKHSFPFLGIRGVYFVPKGYITELEVKLKEVKTEHDEEVNEFLENFDDFVKEWKPQMGNLYDKSLYPTIASLKSNFRFSWTKFKLEVPNDMLTSDEYQEELEKQKQNLIEFVDETITSISTKFYELMLKLQERIGKEGDVSMKQIKSIKTFLDGFANMNISRNSDLEDMAAKMKTVFGKIDKTNVDEDDKIEEMTKIADLIVTDVKAASDDRIKRAVDF